MKLRALELEGFQSYRDRVRVDLAGLNLVAIIGPNGAGKCLPGDTRIYDAERGESLPIEQFVRERRTSTLGFTEGKVKSTPVSDWHDLGMKPLVDVRLSDGTSMAMATTHPVLTDRGCVPAGDLTPGTWVAQASRLPASRQERLTEDEAFILGCFLGDGCARTAVTFSQGAPKVVDALDLALSRAFPGATLRHTPGTFHYWIKSALSDEDQALTMKAVVHRLTTEAISVLPMSLLPNWTKIERGDQGLSWENLTIIERKLGWDLAAEKCLLYPKRAFLEWMRTRGVLGTDSWTKHIPGNLMLMPDAQVKALLTGLWVTDGWVSNPEKGARDASVSTVSRRLALDMKALHLRLGIATSLVRRPSASRPGETTYEVRVMASSWARFQEALPLIGPKAARIAEWSGKPAGRASGRTHDSIPPSFNIGMTGTKSARSYRTQKQLADHSMSREIFLDFGGDPALVEADTLWCKVVAVTDAGEAPCFDVTVDTPEHLYVAETLIVHNSSLLNALEFAFWGKYRGDVVKSVISRGCAMAQVVVEFDLADVSYKIVRTRTATDRHECTLSVSDPDTVTGWRELSEKNPAIADPQIVELLGMDASTARATWLISQSDFGSFCELPPSQRRAALAASFGLDHYATLAQQAEDNRITAQGTLDKAETTHAGLLHRLGALGSNHPDALLNIAELDAEEETAEQEADRLTVLLTQMADETLETVYEDAKRALVDSDNKVAAEHRAWSNQVEKATRTAHGAKAALDSATAAHDEAADAAFEVEDAAADALAAEETVAGGEEAVTAARETLRGHEQRQSALTSEKGALTTQGQDLKERIEALQVSMSKGSGSCFTCQQDLSERQATDVLASLTAARARLREIYQGKDEEAAAVAQRIRQATVTLRDAEQSLRGLRQAVVDAHRYADKVKTLASRVADTEEVKKRADQAYTDAVLEVETLGKFTGGGDDQQRLKLAAAAQAAHQALNAARNGTRSREEVRADRDRARNRQRAIWGEKTRRTEEQRQRDELQAPLERAAAQVVEARCSLDTFVVLREAFRPAGIPAMILAGVVQELNDEANDVLGMLGDTLGVNVTTTKERQGGGTSEKVMVYVTTADGQVDYSTLSGSEKFRVALSLRIALSRCIARRTGTPIETIILDEGWGALDERFKAAVQQVLTMLSVDFSVYTVSHIDDVKSAFPTVIEVSKETGSSQVSVRAA